MRPLPSKATIQHGGCGLGANNRLLCSPIDRSGFEVVDVKGPIEIYV